MLDIGWSEMLVIAVVLIVVVGPKDLPRMLRTFGQMTARMRSMAGDFRKQFDEAMKEAELDDVKKTVDSVRKLDPTADLRKQLNPLAKAAQDVRSGLDAALKPSAPPAPPPSTPVPAEPLKTGPTEMPGEPVANIPVDPAATAKPAESAAPAKPNGSGA